MPIKLSTIQKGYVAIKKIAFKEYDQNNIQKSLTYIDHAAVIAQQFNWIYADNELEDLLMKISNRIIIPFQNNYEPIKNRLVFFDDFCTTYVLALQYIKALVAMGKDILYITTKDPNILGPSNLISLIKSYPGVKIEYVDTTKDRIQSILDVYELIISYKPEQVFLHIVSKSVSIPVLYSLPTGIKKTIINLADQTFWLGSKAIDYSLEFRQFGATVSFEKRGLRKEQLIKMPFYPVMDGNPFMGFPPETNNKVIIFSGGDFYKTIDPDKTYWNIVKSILSDNPDVIFLYATKKNNNGTMQFIDDFIEKNGFIGRFIYIGFRPDVNEVFRHCDIFMGTCPASGSLMSQLAALNAKPILQYYFPGTPDNETEAAICHNSELRISFQDIANLLEEARKLINDKEYRILKGVELQNSMLTEQQFNNNFSDFLNNKSEFAELVERSVDYNLLTIRWYWIETEGFIDTLSFIYSVLGAKQSLLKVPYIWLFYNYKRYILKKLFSSNWYKFQWKKISNENA
jgi:hypothetical protein